MNPRLSIALSLPIIACAASANSEFVTYEQFGAVGDGVADDQAAIVAAHAAANESGLPVRAASGRRYRIGGGAKVAVIRTDVDFGDASFVIDDTSPESRTKPVFRVESKTPPIEIEGLGPLTGGAKGLGVALPGRCHVEFVYAGRMRFIREGLNRNAGSPQREVVVADASGRIAPETPVLWDYPAFTRVTARPVDPETLVISGGSFITVANRGESKYDYHSRGIRVERSNVRICGLRHSMTGELDHGAPYRGFIEVFHAADVTVEDCTFTAHRTYRTIGSAGRPVDMGSYDICVENSANVVFRNCRQTTDILDRGHWGVFTSNFCKNLVFDGCVFSRFDAHQGVAGATIRNCDIGYMGINAIGAGVFLVEDTRVRSDSFFELRTDYGSTWDGEFIVRNCQFAPPACGRAFLVRGKNTGRHDFGYPCSMPRKVTFDNLIIDDSAVGDGGVHLFSDFGGSTRDGDGPAPFEYRLTEKAVLANVTTTSGRDVRVSPNPELFKNLAIDRGSSAPTPAKRESGAVFGAPEKVPGVGGRAMALALEGDRLYVGDGEFLHVYDISDPLSPRKLGETGGLNAIRQLAVQGGMVYAATREYGLWIVDATDPARPRIRSRFDSCELATGVDVAGNICFLAQRQYGVEFIDVSDPDNPRHIAMRKTDESQSVKYRDGFVYSGEWGTGKVTIFDAHDMENIHQVAVEDLHGFGDGVWLQGDYLFCATGHHSMHRKVEGGVVSEELKKYYNGGPENGAGMGHGLDVFDVSDPACPKHVSRLDYPPLYTRWLDMWTPRTSGDMLFAAQTCNGLFAVDISDKTCPRVLDRLTFPDGRKPDVPGLCVGSLAIGDGVVYAAVMDGGLFAIPAKGAKRERFDSGRPPIRHGFREAYPTDEAAWHVWRPPTPGRARAVALRGDVAYAACGDAGLWALAIEPSGGFRTLGKLPGRGSVMDVSVLGDRLFTAEGLDGFGVYELARPAEFREIARLARLSPSRNLALCATAVDSRWAFLGDRHGTDLFDISELPDFRHVLHDGRCPGWDKYLQDRPVGSHIAFSNAHTSLDWIDLAAKPDPVVSLRTEKNNLRLQCGICAFRDGLSLASAPGGYVLLRPNEGDAPNGDGKWETRPIPPAAPGKTWETNMGIPRSDGRLVAFTCRMERRATLYDFSDMDNPVPLAAWKFSGTPETAQFHRGRVVIPCGYQGVLLQRAR